jgi:hypothetical protein
MAAMRDIKVYVTENLFEAIGREVAHCGCTQTAFIRVAILHEILARSEARMKSKTVAVLPGQKTIEDVSNA